MASVRSRGQARRTSVQATPVALVAQPGSVAPAPPSTRLYHIAPRGIGTLETESLTSFGRRLATEHVVSPSALLRHEILEPHRIAKGQRHHALAPVLTFESINGAYKTTDIIVRGLEEGTGVALRSTTMLGRDSAVCFDGAFRHFRAWCRACLAANDPYDRLLWAFTDITTCYVHGILLVDRCSNEACGKQHRPWHRAANASACPYCGAPLSQGARTKAVADASEAIVRDLLALLLTGVPLTSDTIAAGLVALLQRWSWAAVSAGTGVSIATLCGIRRRSIRPQLDMLVNLIGGSGEDVHTFLGHAPSRIVTRRLRKPVKGPGPRGKALAYTPPALEQALRDALAMPDGQIPSAKAFARARKTTVDTLRRRWPQLAADLGRAFRAQENRRRRRREAAEVVLLTEAVNEARRLGDLRKRTVAQLLTRPALFRQKHIQDAYAQLVA